MYCIMVCICYGQYEKLGILQNAHFCPMQKNNMASILQNVLGILQNAQFLILPITYT